MPEESRIEKQKRGKLTNTDYEYTLGVDAQGTVGKVTNPERRAFIQEPGPSPESTPYRQAQYREDVGKRFEAVESIPKQGVTADPINSIGVIPDAGARSYGDRPEPAFRGLERDLGGLKDRFFGQGETIPTRGVTVPKDTAPSLGGTVMTKPPRPKSLESTPTPSTGSQGGNPAAIYHEAEHDAIEEREKKGQLQSTSTQGPGPNPAIRRKYGIGVEGEEDGR